MTKVITYGTYDLLHYGHIRLLERAKRLGDYLIVGVTSEDFDKSRGKINVQQSLMERIEAVKATGLADEIIVEEYEGQKIDDICRNEVDIFAIGSDWVGKFDYLKQYCNVVYLERTEGVSSSQIRSNNQIKLGLLGDSVFLNKIIRECSLVNGIKVTSLCTKNTENIIFNTASITNIYQDMLKNVDAVYIHSTPEAHFTEIKTALQMKKHVICESPISITLKDTEYLFRLAHESDCILQEAIKTAYSTAYCRMLLLIRSGKIGKVVSVDATCTSLNKDTSSEGWNSISSWGPAAMLPVLQIMGTDFLNHEIISMYSEKSSAQELMTNIRFTYKNGIASIKVGKGIKSEGELVISGTKGYIYVPAPWWKTDYFEIRNENAEQTKKYFYQLEGEGIRNEFVSFIQSIRAKNGLQYIDKTVSLAISKIMEDFYLGSHAMKIVVDEI